MDDFVPPYALQLTEIEVMGEVPESRVNRALGSAVTTDQSLFGGAPPTRITDGDRSLVMHGVELLDNGFHYVINLGIETTLNEVVIWARADGCCPERLTDYRVTIHEHVDGQPGPAVWSANRFTDFTNPGSVPGSRDTLTPNLDPSGSFKGQYIRIESLTQPPPAYALQIAEVEAFGTIPDTIALSISQDPVSQAVGYGRPVTFSVGVNLINGDPALLSYQWQKDGENIPEATEASYVIPFAGTGNQNALYRCIISYPELDPLESDTASYVINYAIGATATSNRPLWANWNPNRLVDGNRGTIVHGLEDIEPGFAYEIDLGFGIKINNIDIYPRQDGCCPDRFTNLQVTLHDDVDGAPGPANWTAAYFTDLSNPGSGAGIVVRLLAEDDPSGNFRGQWIRIESLDFAPANYALQMNEVEVYGAPESDLPLLSFINAPVGTASTPGRAATFSTSIRILNGEIDDVTYQWQKGQTDIPGATEASYTTPILRQADENSTYRVVVSYPGVPDMTSEPVTLSFDYNYARGTQAFANQTLWIPGNWNINQIIDGNTGPMVHGHEGILPGFAYEINTGIEVEISSIEIWARQDGCCPERLANYRVTIHEDNDGQIGAAVWTADRFTDGISNPGSFIGAKDVLSATDDPAGTFRGQWFRIQSLEDPVQNYALQIAEVQVFGTIDETQIGVQPTLSIQLQPNGDIVIGWDSGTVESAPTMDGPWDSVAGPSPITVTPTGDARYYRGRK